MKTIIITAVIVNLVVSQIIASSVKNKEISSTRVFWISFLFSPIVGMFVSMMSPQISPEKVETVISLPDYEDDKFMSFMEKNFKYFMMIVFILFLVSIIK